MRKAIICLMGAALSLPAVTTVTGTFRDGTGALRSGAVYISWPRYTLPSSSVVAAGSTSSSIVAGALSVALNPSDTAVSGGRTGFYFTVRYSWETSKAYAWRVPTSPSTVDVTAVETDVPANGSAVLPSIALTQIGQGGATSGQVIGWNGATWYPASVLVDPTSASGDLIYRNASGSLTRFAAPTSGTYCITWTAGVPSWSACAGGGGGGSGNVIGPGSSVSGNVASFNGTDGAVIQDTGIASTSIVTATGTLTSGQLLFGAGSKAVVVGNLSGDVTTSGSGATSIASGVVTLAKMSAGVLSGNGTKLATSTGTLTSGNVASIDANGNYVASGTAVAALVLTSGSYSNPSWITALAWSKITSAPAITGETATTTPTAGAIPKADGSGKIDANWLPAASAENPYSVNVAGWASSGSETVTEATHARGVYANGQCLVDNGTKDEVVACKVERSESNGDLTFTYTTKPDFVLIFRGEKAQGPQGPTGPTGPGIGALLTTKGDIAGYSTAAARVPIGADNKVLMADSAQALGLKWADPPGGVSVCSATGTTSLTCTPSPTLLACGTGTTMVLIPGSTTTGAVTLSATGCTSSISVLRGATGLVNGELRANIPYLIVRTATGWRLVADDAVPGGSGALTKVYTTSPPTWDVTTGLFAVLTGGNALTGSHDFSGASKVVLPNCTIAALPGSPSLGQVCYFTDAASTSDCVTGSGTAKSLCAYNGSAWAKP